MHDEFDLSTSDERVVNELIEYYSFNPKATYDDLVNHVRWYWRGGTNKGMPKEWVIDMINFLTREYSYEDFNTRRSSRSDGNSSVAVIWDSRDPDCIPVEEFLAGGSR